MSSGTTTGAKITRIPFESERDSIRYILREFYDPNKPGQVPVYLYWSRAWRQLFASHEPITAEIIEEVYGKPRLDDYLRYEEVAQ